MYSWGSDTSTWKGSGSYDFGSARAKADSLAAKAGSGPRTYSGGRDADLSIVGTLGKTIHSDSKNPIVIATDVTGSMASWPSEIFDRLPLLVQTLGKYRPDMEISFAAIGDATCDQFPLQVADFASEVDLEKKLDALGAEGGGGGQHRETYELFGYFMLNHAEVPNAVSPKLIMFGDESFYEKIDPGQIKHYIGDDVQSAVDSKQMWKDLQQKFDVYMLHKEYGRGSLDKEIVNQWQDALGEQKVIPLYEAERAVDVALGLIARQWGEFDDFSKSLSARHSKADGKSVYASLRHVGDATTAASKSVLAKSTKGPKSMKLDS